MYVSVPWYMNEWRWTKFDNTTITQLCVSLNRFTVALCSYVSINGVRPSSCPKSNPSSQLNPPAELKPSSLREEIKNVHGINRDWSRRLSFPPFPLNHLRDIPRPTGINVPTSGDRVRRRKSQQLQNEEQSPIVRLEQLTSARNSVATLQRT